MLSRSGDNRIWIATVSVGVAVVLLVAIGLAANSNMSEAAPGPYGDSLRFLPESESSTALVVVLHSYRGDAASIIGYTGADGLVAQGAVVVAPNGRHDSRGSRFWDGTDACCDFDRSGGDDEGYVVDLITTTSGDTRAPVYLVAHSNGSFLAHRLACNRPDLIDGIVVLAGAAPLDAACVEGGTVDVLIVHGQEDQVVRFDGGDGLLGQDASGPYPSARQSAETWATVNGCDVESEEVGTVDLDEKVAGAETVMYSYGPCESGARVELWVVRGAPHVISIGEDFSYTAWNWLTG